MPEPEVIEKPMWQDPNIHAIWDDGIYAAIRKTFEIYSGNKPILVEVMCLEEKLASALFDGTRSALKRGLPVEWIVPEWHKHHEEVQRIEQEGVKVHYVSKEAVPAMNPGRRPDWHWNTMVITTQSAIYIPPHAPREHNKGALLITGINQALKIYEALRQNPASTFYVHDGSDETLFTELSTVFSEGPVDARTTLDDPKLLSMLLPLTKRAVEKGIAVSYKVPEAKRDHPFVKEIVGLGVPIEYVPQHLVAEVIP